MDKFAVAHQHPKRKKLELFKGHLLPIVRLPALLHAVLHGFRLLACYAQPLIRDHAMGHEPGAYDIGCNGVDLDVLREKLWPQKRLQVRAAPDGYSRHRHTLR